MGLSHAFAGAPIPNSLLAIRHSRSQGRGCIRQKPMLVLGIETTCDETAAAVVRRHDDGTGEIVSNVVLSQAAHAAYGGVVPEIAARAHVEVLDLVIAKAMVEAELNFASLDGIA